MTKNNNVKEAWIKVGDDASTLKDDFATAVKDTEGAATNRAKAAQGKVKRDSEDAWRHVKEGAEHKAHQAHQNVEAAAQARKDATDSLQGQAQKLVGKAQDMANYLFSIKSDIQTKVDKVKEDLETSKRPDHLNNEDSWFSIRDVIDDRRSQWRSVEDTAEALKQSALDRKNRIEQAILGLPQDARDEAEKVRSAVADWSQGARDSTDKLVHELRSDWDKTVDDVDHGFKHAAHDIADAFERPSDHHLKLHIHEAINNINKKLALQYVDIENKYNKLDKRLRSDFDKAIFNAGKLKGEYNHLRDDTVHVIRKRRNDALNSVKKDYDQFIRDSRIKLYEAEQALKEYRSAAPDKLEEKKQLANDKINSIKEDISTDAKKLSQKANDAFQLADSKVDEAWSSALGSLREVKDEAKDKANKKWGQTKSKAKGDIHDAYGKIQDKADSVYDRVHGAYHHATHEIENFVDSSVNAIGAFGERVHPGDQYAPVATAWGALFAIWFAYLAVRVWSKRKEAKVWVGDGTMEYMKAMYAPDALIETAEYLGETSDSDSQKPSRTDSAIDVNGRRGKRVTRTVVSKTTTTHTGTTATEQRHIQLEKQHNLSLYQSLTHAVHDLSSYTTTIPLFLVILAVMEFNGFDWRLLNLIYLGLFLAKLLQSQAGQEYAEEMGLGQYFGNTLMLAVTGVVSALTLWSLLTLEIPLMSREFVRRLQGTLNAPHHT
ncbi:hypothetical protein INT44_003149 [Umbelopsis vinacea]|uniref:Uncharacterized protein n=1 Tax=Umbelopsis vinacea TaxID=44442 RepID=A0A8H7UM89_9FUNG|nr:hypothetical protein INT44_003149 [Umbelopsis vinacea]